MTSVHLQGVGNFVLELCKQLHRYTELIIFCYYAYCGGKEM